MLIKYQSRTLSFDAKLGGNTFDLSNIKTDIQMIMDPGEAARSLDLYQFRLCEQYKSVKEKDPRIVNYEQKIERANELFTALSVVLNTFKADPKGQERNLDNVVKNILKFLGIEDIKEDQYYHARPIIDKILLRDTPPLVPPREPPADVPHGFDNGIHTSGGTAPPESNKGLTPLQFYERIFDYLEITYNIIQNQFKIRDMLVDLLEKRFDVSSLEYELMFERFYKDMNDEELMKFKFIRQITEDMAKYNSALYDLLEENRSYLNDGQPLKDLHDHLGLWLAKYRAKKDNSATCLVYVGVEENKPFPREVQKFVSERLDNLKKLNV